MGACDSATRRHQEINKKKESENKLNNSKNNEILKNSQNNFQEENPEKENYYLLCPNCEIRSPHIEKIYFRENLEDFVVKYTCICFENTKEPKEVELMKILTKTEPKNMCNIHSENKLINYCSTCRRAICEECENE